MDFDKKKIQSILRYLKFTFYNKTLIFISHLWCYEWSPLKWKQARLHKFQLESYSIQGFASSETLLKNKRFPLVLHLNDI